MKLVRPIQYPIQDSELRPLGAHTLTSAVSCHRRLLRFIHVGSALNYELFCRTQVFKRGSKSEGATATELGTEEIHRASQTLLSRVSAAALLAVVPDPVTCFKNSSFRQVGREIIAKI